MKKILILLIIAGVIVLPNNSIAQCNFTNAGVELTATPYTDPNTGKCMIKFDLYFDLQSNAGGKYVYVHIWPAASYANLSYVNPPVTADLTGSIASFGFYHHTSGLYMLNSYTPDPGIPNYQFSGLKVTKGPGSLPGYDRFEIEGLVIASTVNCSTPQSFIADAWESQSAAAQNVHCFSKGLTFYANDPRITGELFCTAPRQYSFSINSINTSGLSINYKVCIDVDGNDVYNSAIDTITVNTGSVTLDASNSYTFSSGIMDYLPYSIQLPYCNVSLWVVANSASLPNEVYYLIANNCTPLPVKLVSFTAVRKNENVELNWATAMESQNKGFILERKDGKEDWKNVAFIPTLAPGGNSEVLLSYKYTDVNQSSELSMYRVGQQDINGKTAYSGIRMVKGLAQKGRLLVFPNPSADGVINVVLENGMNNSVLQLVDVNGRVVKAWNQPEGNSFKVTNLPAGMYILRAVTGAETQTIKILVNR